jgi:outer membrane receptor for Fe3+-dicitrate
LKKVENMTIYLEDDIEAPFLRDVTEDASRDVQTSLFIVYEPNARTQVFREAREEVHEAEKEKSKEMVVVGGQVAMSRLSRAGPRIDRSRREQVWASNPERVLDEVAVVQLHDHLGLLGGFPGLRGGCLGASVRAFRGIRSRRGLDLPPLT